jgi:alkanesulfonate monooxygenase SsuD/methylene tetrahydromethanopterin reductase-like flavin-dependent oxidoreductase (luciferase family)
MEPFARGSISLRLYPHNELTAAEIVAELRTQAALAADHGFDGVMTSEHHAGFHGYLPNPLQAAGWCLEAMGSGWAAPSPLLLPLRPAALVAEEVAWLAARFPGRVGIGVASGALQDDFAVMGLTMHRLAERFTEGLEALVGMLSGSDPGALAGDPAIKACAEHPIPIVSAAMGFTAVRRAAALGVGILFDSLSIAERCRELSDAYRDAGGAGPVIIIRRAWVGQPPQEKVDQQLDVYRGYSSRKAQLHWGGNELIGASDPAPVAEGLVEIARAAGADALNIRIHVPDVPREAVREQIAVLGDEVIPRVKRELV